MSSDLGEGSASCTPPHLQERDWSDPRVCTLCDNGEGDGCRGYLLRCPAGAYLPDPHGQCISCPAGMFQVLYGSLSSSHIGVLTHWRGP